MYFLAISNRNAELMAAEAQDGNISGSDLEDEEAPAAKKPRRMVLDDHEEELASTLLSLQQADTNEEDLYVSDADEDQNRNPGSEDEEEMQQEEDISQDVSQEDTNSGLADWGSLMDNGVRFKLLLLLFF
jgi:hypothetical protein